MRQLGLFEYQDLKEFTKWDSGCEIFGEGGALVGQNSGYEIFRWNVDEEEFWMRDTRMECRRDGHNSGCDMFGWNVGEKKSGCDMSGWNVGGEEVRM